MQVSATVMPHNPLYNGTRSMLERSGFTYDCPKGKNNCIMRKVIQPS